MFQSAENLAVRSLVSSEVKMLFFFFLPFFPLDRRGARVANLGSRVRGMIVSTVWAAFSTFKESARNRFLLRGWNE